MIRRTHAILASLFLSLAVLTGCLSDDLLRYDNSDILVPRLYFESKGQSYGSMSGQMMVLPVSRTQITVEREPIVNEFDIINVEMVKVEMGLALMIEVTDTGGRELYRRSVTNRGGRVVFVVNGVAVGARYLDGAIEDGKLYTFVEVPDDELGQFVLDLKEAIAELQTQYSF